MNIPKSSYLLLIILIFLQMLSSVNSALNTHQNITFQMPPIKPYKIIIKQGDFLQVNLFDTNTKFLIAFMSEDQKYLNTQSGHCFKPKVCSLQFRSDVFVTGFIFISIEYSHEYSYEIILNSKTIKKQRILANTQADVFMYPKELSNKTYNLKFYYESDQVKNVALKVLGNDYQIRRGKIKDINITLKQPKNVYSFDFQIPQVDLLELPHQFSIKMTALIPNQMLKGCNGFNNYDPKLRACGQVIKKSQDTFQLHRFGIHPHFILHKQQLVYIKLTVDQFKHFMPALQDQLVTIFLVHQADPKSLRQKPVSWILQNYQTQYRQAKFMNTQCSVSFSLQPGRYTLIPFLTNNFPVISFVYLFQRFNAQRKLVQSYYSVFDSQFHDQKQKITYTYFSSALMEFTSTTTQKNQLVQIDIISPTSQLVVVAYNIFRKIPNTEFQSIKFEVIELGLQNSFSPNMSQVSIITDNIYANRSYLLFVQFHSRNFFIDHYQQGGDKYQLYKTDPYLQNATIQFKIVNGKFSHKKIDQIRVQDDQFYEEAQGSDKIIFLFGIIILTIIVIFISLICCLIKHFRRKQQLSELQTRKLLDQYKSMIQQNLQIKSRQTKQIRNNENVRMRIDQQQGQQTLKQQHRQTQTNITANKIQKSQFQDNSTIQSQRRNQQSQPKSQISIQMTLTQFMKNKDYQKQK